MEKPIQGREDLSSPCRNGYAITPNDTAEIGPYLPKAIYVGGDGDIKALLDGESDFVTFAGAVAGSILPIRPRIIHTDTTATNLVAIY